MHLEEIYNNGTQNSIPENFNIVSVYPNPFNPTTTIEFSISSDTNVSIMVYDVKGKLVDSLSNDNYNAGYHTITWDATMYGSGIYFVKMITANTTSTQKIILIK